jgi:hypothetical protein
MLGWLGTQLQAGGAREAGGGGAGGGGADKYSVKTLAELHAVLARNQDLAHGGPAQHELLVETLRSVAEVIVYGDQHTEQLFDLFCEKNMLPMVVGLLDQPSCPSTLKQQVIQSLSILVQNIRSETSLYYTLSNNHVNRLITHPFNFANEELLGHYISFLKTLSLKLNARTVQFFFDERLDSFPLFQEAARFLDHPEGMVRTAVRAITLNVLRVDDAGMAEWLLAKGQAAAYVEQVVRYVHRRCRRLHLQLVRASMFAAGRPEAGQAQEASLRSGGLGQLLLKLEVALTEQQDHLLYLEDILSLRVRGMETVVVDSTMAYLVLPLFVASLLPSAHPFSELDDLGEKDFQDAGLDKQALERLRQAGTGGASEAGGGAESESAGPDQSGSLLSLFLIAHAFFWFSNAKMLNRLVETLFLPNQHARGEDEQHSEEQSASPDDESEAVGPLPSVVVVSGSCGGSCPATADTAAAAAAAAAAAQAAAAASAAAAGACEDQDTDDTDGASSLAEQGHRPAARRSSIDGARQAASGGNPVRSRFVKFLSHRDERHCLGAACVIYALINNGAVDPELLERTGLAPYRVVGGEEPASAAASDSGHVDGQTSKPGDEAAGSLAVDMSASFVSATSSTSSSSSSSSLGSLAPRKAYPGAVVAAVLEVLRRDDVTTLAQRVLAKLVLDLTAPSAPASGTPGQPILRAPHAAALDAAYAAAVTRVQRQLESPLHRDNQSRLVEIFEGEWLSLCEGPLRVEGLMTLPQVLLPPSVYGGLKQTPLDSRLPFTPLEATRCAVRSLMILRLLWVSLNRRSNSLLSSLATTAQELRQLDGQPVDLRECDYIKLSVMSARGAKAAVQPAFMVLAAGNLLLVEPDTSGVGTGVTRLVAPLHRTQIAQGHNDDLVLHVVVRSPPGQPVGWAHRQNAPLQAAAVAAALPPPPPPPPLPPLAAPEGVPPLAPPPISPITPAAPLPWITIGPASSSGTGSTSGGTSAEASEEGDLREVVPWHITVRFDDHGAAYWARDQLSRAISTAVEAKMRRIRRVVLDRSLKLGSKAGIKPPAD